MAEEIVFKTDARSVKTRKVIRFTLMRILRTKNINDVTVKELTAQSDRNRNSFYTHYRSVQDVLFDVNNDVVGYINKILKKYTLKGFLLKPDDLLNEMSAFIASHKRAATLYMTSTASTEIINFTKRQLTEQVIRCSYNQFGIDNALMHYVVSFYVTGIFDLYYNWLVYGRIEIGELTKLMISFVKDGFQDIKELLNLQEDQGKL